MHFWTLVVLLSLLVGACGKSSKAYRPVSQELRFNLHSEPPNIDPRKATDTTSISVMNLCFEGLMRLDRDGQLAPGAAESYTLSEDQKTYTFTLREAKWSDGTALTAGDFEKTWKTILDPAFPCEFAVDLYLLKNGLPAKTQRCGLDAVGVKALNARTLQVQLEHPTPYFLSVLATHSFFAVPEHIVSTYANWTDGHYIGNGAFRIAAWQRHSAIHFEKNPYYWDKDSIQLEKATFAIVEDESTELNMYENDELDWAGYPLSNLPAEALPTLVKKGLLTQYPIAGTYYYIFNTKQFPFTNANIRRAFSMAINRQAIVANITQMGQTPAMSLVPTTMWKDAKGYFKDNDVTEAKRLFALGLDELGMTADQLGPIRLSYNTMSSHHKIAQAIQQQWQDAFGVKVKLENKEWKVFLDELRHHQFQVARMGGLANINDPITFLDFYRYLSSSHNHSQWQNPAYTELLEASDQTLDGEQRIAFLKKAEKLLIHGMPIAPIYFYTGAYLKKSYVKGIRVTEMNELDLKWAYVEVDDPVSR